MTDPKTRRPEFWRNFGWLFAGVTSLSLAGGTVVVALGSWSGWVNIVLGLIFAPQAVLYFRHWRKEKRELDGGQQP